MFHPRDESGKNDCDFLGPFWCNIKVDPERKVPCGPYKLLVSYVAHQIKEKMRFQKYFSSFLSEISLKFEKYSFFSRSKQQVKTNLDRNSK